VPAPARQGTAGKDRTLEHDKTAVERLAAAIVAQVRGGFRAESPNLAGKDALQNLAEAFKSEGHTLTPDGQLMASLLAQQEREKTSGSSCCAHPKGAP
jgi:hypothetical protein